MVKDDAKTEEGVRVINFVSSSCFKVSYKRCIFKYFGMLTFGFRKTRCIELQFLAVVVRLKSTQVL